MTAFLVKHIVKDRGPLAAVMADVKKTPHSFTAKAGPAEAAVGNDVFVVEVREEGERSYWLGYKYRATEKFRPASGGKWHGVFDFRNSATPGDPALGFYFPAPVRITDVELCDWLVSQTLGMVEIPASLVPRLDTLIRNPANGAMSFV